MARACPSGVIDAVTFGIDPVDRDFARFCRTGDAGALGVDTVTLHVSGGRWIPRSRCSRQRSVACAAVEPPAYDFLDLGPIDCRAIAQAHAPLLLGRVAVSTSWDSGLLHEPAWQQVGPFRCTPPIDAALLASWPVSHDRFCDEWWVFDSEAPAGFAVDAFCNYTGMRIADYRELDFEGGCPLDRYLERFRPVALFGNNHWGYLVRRVDGAPARA